MGPEEIPKLPTDKVEGEDSVNFIRHSVSTYKTYGGIVSSEDPQKPFKHNEQLTPDLPEKGIELAKQEAEKFFANLDPEKDTLFFASSNEARALETANIYREIAHTRGFAVIKPDNSRSQLSDTMAEGEIRVLQTLSIYPDKTTNALIDSVFNPPKKRGNINWAGVSPEFKARFDKASAIIEADDKGSFGPNFAAHSEEIVKIFPEITTSEELYKTQFKNLIKLARFGLKKAELGNGDKNVKILAYGHENYLMYALEKLFNEDGIKNCETIHISTDEDDSLQADFRGKKASL